MRRLSFMSLAAVAALAVTVGCSQPAAAPTPTKAAEPAKAAAPTKAAEPAKAAEPTKAAAPAAASKATFPEKGKAINIICLMPAGGAMDVSARVMAVMLEKELGTPVQVVNKVGAGGQVGLTELAKSAPDGYTISNVAMPAVQTMYLDPDRKCQFTKNDFTLLGMENTEPVTIAVKADSPYKTLKDVIDAAKAKPNEVRASVSGVLVVPHLGALEFMKATDTKLRLIHFDGGPPALTAMLGGHTEMDFEFTGTLAPAMKSNQVRVLAVMDSKEYQFQPGVPTVESFGYKAYMNVQRGYVAPKGIPKEAAEVLTAAIKKVVNSEEYKSKLADIGMQIRYRTPEETMQDWNAQEEQMKPLLEIAKAQMKQK